MSNQIEHLALKMANEIILLRELYPTLCDYTRIKRILNLADLFIATMEGASK